MLFASAHRNLPSAHQDLSIDHDGRDIGAPSPFGPFPEGIRASAVRSPNRPGWGSSTTRRMRRKKQEIHDRMRRVRPSDPAVGAAVQFKSPYDGLERQLQRIAGQPVREPPPDNVSNVFP